MEPGLCTTIGPSEETEYFDAAKKIMAIIDDAGLRDRHYNVMSAVRFLHDLQRRREMDALDEQRNATDDSAPAPA